MTRLRIVRTTHRSLAVTEEIEAQDLAGDEFACLEEHDCRDPRGHLFKTQCGETKCVHCPKVGS